MDTMMNAMEQVSLFCRLNMNTRRNLPIRSSEMGMLIYLVKADGEKTAKGVADFFKVTKAMATNMSSALLKNGFLEKQQQENDKRIFLLRPTEKSVQLVNETYYEYMKQMNILRNSMGEAAFHTLLDLLNMANVILLDKRSKQQVRM